MGFLAGEKDGVGGFRVGFGQIGNGFFEGDIMFRFRCGEAGVREGEEEESKGEQKSKSSHIFFSLMKNKRKRVFGGGMKYGLI